MRSWHMGLLLQCSGLLQFFYLYLLLIHFHAEITLCPRPPTQVNQGQVLHTQRGKRESYLVSSRAQDKNV